ncbi:hypothetical protein Ddye_003541 [Dipteronia dyeriana]|uniref:Uncharacterized protein n=1 Tax=Dipteronia dyeriana TaxID=168575 RepID=A0AAD9XTP2_9ROSI|nr:hypothetical protein Ddye_003541 [Dipteronia dyeriana]
MERQWPRYRRVDQGDCRFCEVEELNKKMRTGYSNNYFVDLLGMTVDQLWSEYVAKYERNCLLNVRRTQRRCVA